MTDYEMAMQRFAYEPETGLLRWKISPNRRITAGSIAGALDHYGYIRCCTSLADGRRHSFAVHRLAWLVTHGAWPLGEIDHINGVRNDNRIANLRDVDRSGNMLNRRGADRDNLTGLRGASLHRTGKYLAQFRGSYFGLHDTPEEAHQAAKAALLRATQAAA